MAAETELDDLLRTLGRRTAGGAWPVPAELVAWLARRIGAEAALVGESGGVEAATTGFPHGALDGLRPLLRRLRDGGTAAAVHETREGRLTLEAVGAVPPRPVLALLHTAALPSPARALASHTASLLALLRGASRAEEAADAYRRKAGELRVAVFMALMAGRPELARRMTTGNVPALLGSDLVRVHLLRCPPDHRERLASRHEDRAGYHGRGLMVRCPVYDDHLICLVPAGPGRSGGPGADAPADLGGLLRGLVAENARYALGISAPHPQGATAVAYEEARNALAMARAARDRTAEFAGPSPLETLLPRAAARAWAEGLLRPLADVPAATVELLRLVLSFSRVGAARLAGLSRNTVTARLRPVEAALGLGLRDVRSRAALALALALTPSGAAQGPDRPAPTLAQLLATPPAVAWARALLAPLRPPGRPELLTTARAWIEENADAQRAASRLGSSRNTVRARLRTVEQLVGRDLLGTGSGVHDLVHALAIDAG
ncbi:helix-turn-helix domain-containing protein [Streptomyces avicenniae]|uniref:helix-turn-helix domain-containing protein n=1 Tax=Streptomyces avicenniae TaxID=500153 RepID=UPI000A3F30D5|nr:helix-turn-helix domain-containing protein [Streptomyces avicenniae]